MNEDLVKLMEDLKEEYGVPALVKEVVGEHVKNPYHFMSRMRKGQELTHSQALRLLKLKNKMHDRN